MNLNDPKISELAYNALNDFFNEHNDEVVEIEILPPAIQPTDGLLMTEGLNVGIPKKVLVLAYVKARQLFLESIKDGKTSLKTLEASQIVLLFDPEHITAANYRKRRILNIKADSEHRFNEAISRELVFLNSILTSPLHRQSKSPTLWYHRAWLLDLLISPTVDGGLNEASRPEDRFIALISAELEAVMKAGERHPRNYYAWQYARRLFTRVENVSTDDRQMSAWSWQQWLHNSASAVTRWCLKHPSDTSGWSFLLFHLEKMNNVMSCRDKIVNQVLEYAINLQAEQLSLWIFLRTALADSGLKDGRALIQMLHEFYAKRAAAGGLPSTEDPVAQATTWIKSYRRDPTEITKRQNADG